MSTPTGCAFTHDDAAYVLGALSPAERLEFERHLAGCDDCSRSVRSLAGMPGLLDRAVSDPGLADAIVQEYRDARELDVFGVPSLRLGDASPIYGPILPEAPSGAEALEWWEHISWLIGRDDVYELKRWPRGRRPGLSFTSP